MRTKKNPGARDAGARMEGNVNSPLLPDNRPHKQASVAVTLRGDGNTIIGLAVFSSAAAARSWLLAGGAR